MIKHKRVRMSLLATAAIGALALGACGGEDDTEPAAGDEATQEQASGGSEVTINTFQFKPGDIEVKAGDTVTWTNGDDILHTVTSGKQADGGVPGVTEKTEPEPDGTFDGDLELDDTFSYTFDKPGTYDYFCEVHVAMVGRVTVK